VPGSLTKVGICAGALLAIFGVALSALGGEQATVLKFDMGTAQSPLKEGYVRVTPGTLYSSDRGYGWETQPAAARDSTDHAFKIWGQTRPAVGYVLGADGLTADCVSDPESLEFCVTLANGTYDVAVWVGDLATPLTHISISANGKSMKEDFDSRTLWRLHMDTEFGAYRIVQSIVEVTDGELRINVTGKTDAETEYVEKRVGSAGELKQLVARMAFTEVAVQGLVVHASVRPRLEMIGERHPR